MSVELQFQAILEDTPDEKWKAIFQQFWPGYRAWFLRSGVAGRPTYLECRQALRTYMPELIPIWEKLIALTGGGDVEARFYHSGVHQRTSLGALKAYGSILMPKKNRSCFVIMILHLYYSKAICSIHAG